MRDHLNILESLYQEAVDRGIMVTSFSMPTAIAASVLVGGRGYIGIDRSQLATSREESECLAHEMGHLSTGSLYAVGERGRKRAERRAEEWAIKRLVSRERFAAACRGGCSEVWQFAEALGISYPFAEKVVSYYLGAR